MNLNFSGHETFTPRYGWLKKVYDKIASNKKVEAGFFEAPERISDFGVGKNMVKSMKYWAIYYDIIFKEKNSYSPTQFGKDILSDDVGFDPYIENEATLWLLHWKAAQKQDFASSLYFTFNEFSRPVFTKEELLSALIDYSLSSTGRAAKKETVKRDIDCLLATYTYTAPDGKKIFEERILPPFAHLKLITHVADTQQFQFNRTPKLSLPDEILAACILEFVSKQTTKTITLNSLTYDVTSPGRIFKLDEDYLAKFLLKIENYTNGSLSWTESASLSQIVINNKNLIPKTLVANYYKNNEAQ
jgi:hypothetical protein